MAKHMYIHPNRIVNGAVAFGIAHLFYIFILLTVTRGTTRMWIAVAIIALASFFAIAVSKQSKTLLIVVFYLHYSADKSVRSCHPHFSYY